jgi:hypothetical protein
VGQRWAVAVVSLRIGDAEATTCVEHGKTVSPLPHQTRTTSAPGRTLGHNWNSAHLSIALASRGHRHDRNLSKLDHGLASNFTPSLVL